MRAWLLLAKKSKFLRFPIVGLASSLIYAAATSIYIAGFHLDSKAATLLGYASAMPFSFLAHRSFTFGSTGAFGTEFFRFALVHAVGALVSWLAMGLAVERLHLHYAIGIVGAVVLVPVISFLVFDRWVFKSGAADNCGR